MDLGILKIFLEYDKIKKFGTLFCLFCHKILEKNPTEMLALSRHRNISLIFITQSSGLIDKNILALTDYFIFKETSDLQIEFERIEIKKFFKKAKEKFHFLQN